MEENRQHLIIDDMSRQVQREVDQVDLNVAKREILRNRLLSGEQQSVMSPIQETDKSFAERLASPNWMFGSLGAAAIAMILFFTGILPSLTPGASQDMVAFDSVPISTETRVVDEMDSFSNTLDVSPESIEIAGDTEMVVTVNRPDEVATKEVQKNITVKSVTAPTTSVIALPVVAPASSIAPAVSVSDLAQPVVAVNTGIVPPVISDPIQAFPGPELHYLSGMVINQAGEAITKGKIVLTLGEEKFYGKVDDRGGFSFEVPWIGGYALDFKGELDDILYTAVIEGEDSDFDGPAITVVTLEDE